MFQKILMAMPWYHHKTHKGISRFAAEHNWHVNASWSRFRIFPGGWLGDGIITQRFAAKELGDFIVEHNVPIVTISPTPIIDGSPCVYDPASYIAQTAYDYFAHKGFNHFATYECGDDSHSRTFEFRKIANSKGKDCYQLQTTEPLSLDERTDFLIKKLTELPKPVALFCASDEIAAEVIMAAAEGGIDVPHEVSILGVHNDELTCESTTISLSSIDCGLEQMGYEAASVLNKMINGEDYPLEVQVKYAKVVTRASTDTLAVTNVKVRRALQFIHNNFQHQVSLEQIAQSASASVSSIRQLFQKYLLISPIKELNRVRLNHAKNLLLNHQWSIDLIAKESGFGSNRNLYRAFEREEQLSPDAYRKRYSN